jgi:hypothetical protein
MKNRPHNSINYYNRPFRVSLVDSIDSIAVVEKVVKQVVERVVEQVAEMVVIIV